jgi:hypothetical protein
MKRSLLNPMLRVLACMPWFSAALAGEPAFEWRQPIRGGVEQGQLYRIRVTPELFDGCRAFPSDIRVLADGTNQWPFFIWAPAPSEDVVTLDTEILNTSVDAGPERFLRADVHLLGGAGNPRPRHDRITINTAGDQYVRRVEVLGSDDGADWKRMASGYLVDQRREIQIVSRTIFYPLSDYPWLQVRIYPNAQHADEDIVLRGVSVGATVRKEGETEAVELSLSELPPDDRRPGINGIVMDQGVEGRPLASLKVEAGPGEYTRAVRISGRNEPTNAWRWVAEGSLLRFGDQERNTIDLKDTFYRYLLLEEFHYDDVPIRVERVTASAVPRYIVFEAGQGDDPGVRYGSTQASVPRYDLQRRTKEDRIRAARLLELGRPLALATPQAALPYGRWLALLGVGVASLVVILVVVNMVRRETR